MIQFLPFCYVSKMETFEVHHLVHKYINILGIAYLKIARLLLVSPWKVCSSMFRIKDKARSRIHFGIKVVMSNLSSQFCEIDVYCWQKAHWENMGPCSKSDLIQTII